MKRKMKMAKRIRWDIYEAVLLVDAFFLIEKGCLERMIAVQMISDELRQKAINAKMDIDDIFRNPAGINMHLYGIQYIVNEGKSGMKNTSELLIQAVDMYKNFPNQFHLLLQKAKSMTGSVTNQREDKFLSWLEDSEYGDKQEEVELALRIVNMFARNKCFIRYSLLEIINVEKVREVKRIIENNICEQKIKLKYDFDSLFKAYLEYLTLETTGKVNEIVAEKSFNSDEEIENFSRVAQSYSYATNIAISYENIMNSNKEEKFLGDAEEIIKGADIDGITVRDISDKIGKSIWAIKKYLRDKEYVIEIPGDVYIHADNVVDIYENKEAIQKIIENQFVKFAGYTNDVILFDAVSIKLGMFLNDNCIDKPEKMYGIARFLFEKNEKMYYFAGDKHIWKDLPQYTSTYAGVLLGYISSNGGKASKVQCTEYLQKVKLPSNNINGILSIATNKQVLLYGNEEYVLADYVIRDELWLEQIKIQLEKFFRQSLYVVPREISDNWFELLPNIDGGMSWNLLFVQDLIKKYLPEYRLITANENQGLETIRAGIVPKDSFIEDFADLVYVRILEDSTISLPVRIDKEDFRQKLIEYKMIQGNELIYTMPKAVAGSKFAWTSEGDSVLILKE